MVPAHAHEWHRHFPLLRDHYRKKSDQTRRYNCIALAIGDWKHWWWPVDDPDAYWPPSLPLDVTLDNFVAAFQQNGYEVCAEVNHEAEFQKVALYTDRFGVPTHAARQTRTGNWYSKIGRNVDILHPSPRLLEGPMYGIIAVAMKRPWTMGRRFSALMFRIRTSTFVTRCIGMR
jgi:hypothetical protein